MKRSLMIGAVVALASSSAAQNIPNPDPLPPCDWAWHYGSPEGIATQTSYNEIATGWDCHGGQPIVDYIWREMDFEWWTTDLNHGFNEPCNPTYPIGRAITASMLMGYSGNGNPTCNVRDTDILEWALCWAASRYDELATTCRTTSTAMASTETFPGNQTWLYPRGMYTQEVSHLSGTIMHEARHYDCLHNGGSDCPRGSSCDDTWHDGCPWPSNAAGANRFQIVWLQSYGLVGTRGSIPLRESAVERANEILSAAFTHRPCFRLAPDGTPMDVRIDGCR